MQFRLQNIFIYPKTPLNPSGHRLHSECGAHCVIYFTASFSTMNVKTLTLHAIRYASEQAILHKQLH